MDGFFYSMFIYVGSSSLLVVCPVVLLILRKFHFYNFMIISLRGLFSNFIFFLFLLLTTLLY